jgi:hypothetical protein
MSGLSVLILAFAVVVCAMLLVVAAALFSPVVVTVDSAARELRVRWLLMIEYVAALPGGKAESRLSIAGNPVTIRPKERRQRSEPTSTGTETRTQERRAGAGFVFRCLRNPTIRRVLSKQTAKLVSGILHSVALTRSRVNLSLPDPALTGMLASVLGQSRWGRKLGVGINFAGANSAFCEVRLYPHRVVKTILLFLGGLPYMALYRNWRPSA